MNAEVLLLIVSYMGEICYILISALAQYVPRVCEYANRHFDYDCHPSSNWNKFLRLELEISGSERHTSRRSRCKDSDIGVGRISSGGLLMSANIA